MTKEEEQRIKSMVESLTKAAFESPDVVAIERLKEAYAETVGNKILGLHEQEVSFQDAAKMLTGEALILAGLELLSKKISEPGE